MIFAVILCGTSFTFVDPTLSDHLSEFNLSTSVIGLLFLLSGGLYSVTAPIWGLFIDRWHCCNALLIFGAILTAISMLLIGPTSIFSYEKNLLLIGISLSLLGIGSGAIYIPTFQNCLDAVKSFIGPTFGGYGVQYIGFEWSATTIAFINFAFVLILMLGWIAKKL
uniref:Major facilitator superfamily (MFS) profile domain-containing protein n=1 Tax=Panagrolaimus sp. ES5 TaxID=591445 RepID=A0AC34FT15_9BILA